MRDCPKCNAPVDGLRCAACGFSEAGAATDPASNLCTHVEAGVRCPNPGTISAGFGAPRYCGNHYPGLARDRGGPAPDGTFEHLRRLTKRVAPVRKPVDFEAVVERIAIQGEEP